MKLTIEIKCDNSAFYDGFDGNEELSELEILKILERIRFDLRNNFQTKLKSENIIIDTNGNSVGFYKFTE